MDYSWSSSSSNNPYKIPRWGSTSIHHEEEDNNKDQRQEEEEGGSNLEVIIERENMFDKVVTPSDVGKLNRLVIPKQHAEKYFPLDSSTHEKGLLLNFQDPTGKPWRFRYSYWNSSQSYVMTKGWSRFVKDKKLDAGDIVSFLRGVGEKGKDKLFIDWRRRPPPQPPLAPPYHHRANHPGMAGACIYGSPLTMVNTSYPCGFGNVVSPQYPGTAGSLSFFYRSIPQMMMMSSSGQQERVVQVHGKEGGGVEPPPPPLVFESVPVVQGKVAAKRLRLFGVNMDCPISSNYDVTSSSSTSSTSNQEVRLHHHHHPHELLPLQLGLYSDDVTVVPDKGKSSSSPSSSMSLDLDI